MRLSAARSTASVFFLAGLIASCSSGPDEQAASSNQPLLTGPHRVQASGMASVQLVQAGGKLIADYGSFALIDIDGAKLSSMPKDSYLLRDEYRNVMLNAGAIDALDASAARLRETALPATGKQLHLVQFAGAVKPEWHAQLQATGVRIVEYIPHNAYLVYGDATQLSRVISYARSAPEVQWDGPYLDDYKLNPRVYSYERPDGYQVQLVEDAQGNVETLARAAALEQQGRLVDQRALGYVNLIVHTDQDSALALSKQPDVVSIYPWMDPRKLDERAKRSEERRVGKECKSQCRSRWSPYH